MISTLRLLPSEGSKRLLGSVGLALVIGAVLGTAAMLLFGSGNDVKLAYGFIALFTVVPLVAYVIFRRPVLSFAAYAALVPLENLIHVAGVGTLARIFGAATGLVLIISLMLRRRAVMPDRAAIFWGVLLVWMCMTLFWALDPTYAGTINIVQVAQLWALYLLISITPLSPADLQIVIIGSVVGGLTGGAYSINQYIHGVRDSGGSQWTRLYLNSGTGDTIDSNHFAAAMQLPIALAWVAALYAKRMLPRLLMFGALGVMFVAVLLGASRGGIVALAVMSIFFAWRARRIKETAIVLGIALLASLGFPSVWARFNDPSQGEGSGRFDIWKVGFDAFQQHWLGGVGAGNFQVAYDRSLLRVYQPEYQGWSRPSHNVLVGISTELGVIGLALLVTAAVRQFRSIGVVRRGTPYFPIRIALEGAMLALIAESMFLDTLWYKYVWLTFSVMAAVRATYLNSPEISEGAPVESATS